MGALARLSAIFAAFASRAGVQAALPLPTEIDVYHINPFHLGPIPINMDTGDAAGDLFFDLIMVIMNPVVCADKTASRMMGLTCENQEVKGSDLVVNRLHLRVSGDWSGYAMCNIGDANGTDPHGRKCEPGRYCCYCGNFFGPGGGGGLPGPHNWTNQSEPCNATVGRESLKERARWPIKNLCNETAPEWLCWLGKLSDKLEGWSEGYWYSTLDYGYCPHHPGMPSNCTWEVASVDKVVNKTCHTESFFSAVEAYNSTCFQACGAVRNITSACWIRCFYTAVLGPEASKPGGRVTGIPTKQLVEAWSAPFMSADVTQGGCPGLPVPHVAAAPGSGQTSA